MPRQRLSIRSLLRWALVACVGLIAGCAVATAAPPSWQPGGSRSASTYRILYVGASITAGTGASGRARSYPRVLTGLIARRVGPVSARVVAHPGAELALAALWPSTSEADLVIVHMATNDYLQGTPLLLYRMELRALLGRLRARSPRAAIACLGVWSSPASHDRAGLTPTAYDRIVTQECTSVRGTFVPLAGIYTQSRLHAPPRHRRHRGQIGFHPNDAGHAQIARAVYAALVTRHVLPGPQWPATEA